MANLVFRVGKDLGALNTMLDNIGIRHKVLDRVMQDKPIKSFVILESGVMFYLSSPVSTVIEINSVVKLKRANFIGIKTQLFKLHVINK